MFERIKHITNLVSYRELRNAALSTVIVMGGLALSILTLIAHRSGNLRLAGIAATLSLVFVVAIVLFVIPPLARNASLEASQINLPFEFTSGGGVFIGLIVVTGFAAWNTGNNLLFIILSVLVSSLIVSIFVGYFMLKKLDVRMRFPEFITAGEKTRIQVLVENRKRVLPSFSVLVEVRGKEREFSRYLEEYEKALGKKIAQRVARSPLRRFPLDYFLVIPRNDQIEDAIDYVFSRRGRFSIRDFELSTRFPFGFIRHRRRLQAQEAELIVFPSAEEGQKLLDNLPSQEGVLNVLQKGLGRELFALREYSSSDDYRYIHWKATARIGSLMVKEFATEDDLRVMILFDTRILEETNSAVSLRQKIAAEQADELLAEAERFETGVKIVGALLDQSFRADAEIGALIGKERFEIGNGLAGYAEIMRELAIANPSAMESGIGERIIAVCRQNSARRVKIHQIVVTAMDDFPLEIKNLATIVKY